MFSGFLFLNINKDWGKSFVVEDGGVEDGDGDEVDDVADFGVDVDEVDRLLETHLDRAD